MRPSADRHHRFARPERGCTQIRPRQYPSSTTSWFSPGCQRIAQYPSRSQPALFHRQQDRSRSQHKISTRESVTLKNDQSSIPKLSAFDEKSAMMRRCDPRINESDPPGGTTGRVKPYGRRGGWALAPNTALVGGCCAPTIISRCSTGNVQTRSRFFPRRCSQSRHARSHPRLRTDDRLRVCTLA